jgi:regulator of ribonuclease activity A
MNKTSDFSTADLCDEHGDMVQAADPIFRDYGGAVVFGGAVATVKVYDDNTSVRAMLETAGDGRVLVVDGGGSLSCALVGDRLAQLALDNGWSGVVVNGCVRDSAALARLPLGVKALATHPRRSEKRGAGQVNVPVAFAGVNFEPGLFLYADGDGVILSARELTASGS